MSLPLDLLEQADHLVSREPRRPRQASLRRAVSASYYGLFHLLTGAATSTIAPNVPSLIDHRIQRWFNHAEMKKTCTHFLSAQLNNPLFSLVGPAVSPQLQTIARTFVQLQEARHSADYDLGWTITREEAKRFVALIREAFGAWNDIKSSSEANVFLISLLLWDKWEKKRS